MSDRFPDNACPSPGAASSPDALVASLREENHRQTLEIERLRRENAQREAFLNTLLGSLPAGVAVSDAQGGSTNSKRAAVALRGTAPEAEKSSVDALRRSEAQLSAIFERARIGISEISVQGRFLRVNDALCDLLTRRKSEILALGVADVTHPDDWGVTLSMVEAVVATGQSRSIDKRYVRPDGALVWATSTLTRLPAGPDGVPTLLAVTMDLTSRRAAEEALRKNEEILRLIFESAREFAIFTTDPEGKITKWNRGAERILGYAEDEVLGRQASLIHPPDGAADGSPHTENHPAGRDREGSEDRWIRHKDGSRLWCNTCLMSMRDIDGKTVGFLHVLRDETERRRVRRESDLGRERLQEALRTNETARTEIEAASRAKDRFLAVLSHELRTPLTPILMAVDALLEKQDLPPRFRQLLEMIRRNVRIEVSLIDDLLDITRINRGRLPVDRSPVEMHEVIDSAVEICRHDIELKDQTLRVNLEADRTRLSGDARRLRQVVWNLLKNAAKFTGRDGRITVTSWSDTDRFCISIQDTGIGIAPEDFHRVFDAFEQVDAEATCAAGGLGLGLAISKAAVEAHGGTLSVHSAGSGHGTTFTLSIPLRESPQHRAE